jgi:predicted aspartyl protease
MLRAMRLGPPLAAFLSAAGAFCSDANLSHAECVAPPSAELSSSGPAEAAPAVSLAAETVMGESLRSAGRRVVAPVNVNGQGPFRFIVDTGANRSVLSQALAERLGLTPHGIGEVNSIVGVSTAPLVAVSAVDYQGLTLPSAPMPVLSGPMFAGEQGLLGVDGMEGRRLLIDLERGCVEVRPSHGAPRLIGWTTIRGELRFGHLVVMPGRIRDVPINVIIDTGSDSSLANVALRDALSAHLRYDRERLDAIKAYTAGWPVIFDSAIATPRLRLGELDASHVYAYVGDFHVFDLWGLSHEPALLIGMDVLSQVRAFAIDYGRGVVQFRLKEPDGASVLWGYGAASRIPPRH